jgi:SWI/SNF-related matrix-associated actin-dependent regulator of chromatin subfamily A-like protein 1
MELRRHQHEAVRFLCANKFALLCDEQRVGKTAPAIVAAKRLDVKQTLIVAPVSTLGNWHRECVRWGMPGNVVIVPWSRIATGKTAAMLLTHHFDLIIFDEFHYGKNPTAKRTQAAFGVSYGANLNTTKALCSRADRVWCLSGTPIPHDPGDLYPVLRAIMPETLHGVLSHEQFLERYVVRVPKKVGPYRKIWVAVGGRNEQELHERIKDKFLRRRQRDVGIAPPIVDLLMLDPGRVNPYASIDEDAVRQAAMDGDTRALDMHLGVLRHITGDIKAERIIEAALDYFESSPEGEKLVIAYWHRSVGDRLEEGLRRFHPMRVDGSTLAQVRTDRIDTFQRDPKCRIFLGQIEAAGEGIDLSAADELWFAESTFSPRNMSQMSMRIANVNKKRQNLVRIATLDGSIDVTIQETLARLMVSIAKTLGEAA